MKLLQIGIRSMVQAVETLSGGQRQGVAVARSAAFARHVVILDEPTAALGVKEGNMVLELIRRVRDKGLPVILITAFPRDHVRQQAEELGAAGFLTKPFDASRMIECVERALRLTR